MAASRLLSSAAAPFRAVLKARAPATSSPQHPPPPSRLHTAANQRSPSCYSTASSGSSGTSSTGAGTPGKGSSRGARNDAETETAAGGRGRKSPQRRSSSSSSSSGSGRSKRLSSGVATRSSHSVGKNKKPLSVYLLRSAAPGCNSTYCGTTRSLGSRLQQHNGLRKVGNPSLLIAEMANAPC